MILVQTNFKEKLEQNLKGSNLLSKCMPCRQVGVDVGKARPCSVFPSRNNRRASSETIRSLTIFFYVWSWGKRKSTIMICLLFLRFLRYTINSSIQVKIIIEQVYRTKKYMFFALVYFFLPMTKLLVYVYTYKTCSKLLVYVYM